MLLALLFAGMVLLAILSSFGSPDSPGPSQSGTPSYYDNFYQEELRRARYIVELEERRQGREAILVMAVLLLLGFVAYLIYQLLSR